jgi:hypothetical protein
VRLISKACLTNVMDRGRGRLGPTIAGTSAYPGTLAAMLVITIVDTDSGNSQ